MTNVEMTMTHLVKPIGIICTQVFSISIFKILIKFIFYYTGQNARLKKYSDENAQFGNGAQLGRLR